MTTYICKVFTPEFKARLEEQMLKDLEVKIKEEGRTNANGVSLESFQAIMIRMNYNYMWNNPHIFDSNPEIKEYYTSIGLWTPEFTTIELQAAEAGFQSRARVMWNGKVEKIDDIDEIFSYTTKSEE